MFGFDDALMAAFAEEAAMTEGVNTALAAQQAAEAAAAANAAATANELSMAGAAGLGTVGAGAGAAGQGITQAGVASNVLGGGAGAGEAGINAAQVGAQQAQATAVPNSGMATRGLTQIPQTTSMPTGVPEGYQGNVARASMNYIDPVDSLRPTISSAPPESDLMKGFEQFAKEHPNYTAAGAYMAAYHSGLLDPRNNLSGQGGYSGPLNSYKLSPNFQGRFANPQDYQPTLRRFQSGGIADITGGRMPVEQMSNAAAIGMNTGFPQADISGHAYATPWQTPVSQNVVQGAADTGVNRMDDTMFAGGGTVDLHGTIDLGGAGGPQGANGYQAAGSGSGSLANEERPSWAQQGMPYSYAHGMQQPQTLPQFGFAMQQAQPNFLAGIDPTGIMSGAPRQASFAGQGGIADMMRSMLQNQGAAQMSPDKRAQLQAMYKNAGMQVYAKGGSLSSTIDFYRQMYDPDKSGDGLDKVAAKGDPGIYYDMDPDTRYQDALTAAQIRNAKVAKRANMQMPTGKRPTPMGSINLRPPGAQSEQAQSSLDPENAAQGGIMQAHGSTLGGYAAGGNPRLLKGPGDGMSDNIPATIAGKQPARLADGEFVIPADVVSHLGNGSTDAGAKKLHHMMDSVRQARTGRKAQGKQINPNKFMPK